MESPTAPLNLTLSDLVKVKVKVTQILKVISHNEVKLGPRLLLIINRKPYMASPMTP